MQKFHSKKNYVQIIFSNKKFRFFHRFFGQPIVGRQLRGTAARMRRLRGIPEGFRQNDAHTAGAGQEQRSGCGHGLDGE